MEWEKAKTILIILLALLNAGLFGMSLLGGAKYKMSQEDVSAITSILAENGITLDCEPPLENKPASLITLSAQEWDYDYIKGAFFPEEAMVRVIEEGSVIYRTEGGGRSITVTNARNTEGVSELIYTEEKASKSEPGEYVSLLGKDFRGFELRWKAKDESGDTFLYNDSIKSGELFVSYAEVSFLDGGVIMRVKKFNFVSYVEGAHEIFRADEALLAFAHYKNENIKAPVKIGAMQFGYFAESAARDKTVKAKPYYRLFLEGSNEPVLIDAVMNTVL